MTIDEIRDSNRETLFLYHIAPILRMSEMSLRLQARQNPQNLGFPVIVCGTRVKVPRRPFLRYLGYEPDEEKTES